MGDLISPLASGITASKPQTCARVLDCDPSMSSRSKRTYEEVAIMQTEKMRKRCRKQKRRMSGPFVV